MVIENVREKFLKIKHITESNENKRICKKKGKRYFVSYNIRNSHVDNELTKILII